jgi:hypothetical protein
MLGEVEVLPILHFMTRRGVRACGISLAINSHSNRQFQMGGQPQPNPPLDGGYFVMPSGRAAFAAAASPQRRFAKVRLLIAILFSLWASISFAYAAKFPTYNITVNTASNLGNVVSAQTSSTIFTVNPADGTITRSGSAVRLSSGDARAKITVTCVLASGENANDCSKKYAALIYVSAGAVTNRAGPLNNFTVSLITDTYDHNPTTGSSINFALSAANSAQFYLGFDFTVLGDNSGKNTGVSAAAISFETCASQAGACVAGATHSFFSPSATATVFRPIAMANSQGLVFGRIVRPNTGSGSVTMDPASGVRTATGGASFVSVPAATPAVYAVTGEGGQVFSISVPPTFSMTGPGGASVTTTLTSTATGSAALSAALGSAGSYSFKVGGSIPLSSTTTDGAYSGSYTVMVQYN